MLSSYVTHIEAFYYILSTEISAATTVKPEIFACPLFREFRNLRQICKNNVRVMNIQYSISYTVLLLIV